MPDTRRSARIEDPVSKQPRCRACDGVSTAEFLEKEGYRYRRCLGCDMVFADLDEDFLIERNRRVFNETYGHETPQDTPEPSSGAKVSRKEARKTASLARLERFRSSGRLLEIGCANGDFLLRAREQGWQVEGVEIADEAAEVARRRGLDVAVGTLESCRLPAARFDVVYMNEVLEHIFYPRQLLGEVRRILRPGGALFLRTRNPASWTVLFCGASWHHFTVAGGHVSFFSPRTFRAVLPQVGFETPRVRTWGSAFHDRYTSDQKLRRRLSRWAGRLLDPLAGLLEKGQRIEVLAVAE